MNLDVMAEIAQPLDQWCVFGCGRLGTLESADGVWACEDCAKQVIEAEAKYAAELVEARPRRPLSAKQAKARAKRRAKRKRARR